jgi:hypothetical protein
MNTDERGFFDWLTGRCFRGSNTLGAGFIEKVYERVVSDGIDLVRVVHGYRDLKLLLAGGFLG